MGKHGRKKYLVLHKSSTQSARARKPAGKPEKTPKNRNQGFPGEGGDDGNLRGYIKEPIKDEIAHKAETEPVAQGEEQKSSQEGLSVQGLATQFVGGWFSDLVGSWSSDPVGAGRNTQGDAPARLEEIKSKPRQPARLEEIKSKPRKRLSSGLFREV
jgi:hypothetical protein